MKRMQTRQGCAVNLIARNASHYDQYELRRGLEPGMPAGLLSGLLQA
jgi:hypothetical protein